VLDGLKHGYPLRAAPDTLLASLLVTGWCLCVRPRFCPLFACTFLASFAPDVADLGPKMLRSAALTDPVLRQTLADHGRARQEIGFSILRYSARDLEPFRPC
jgi:hypothetical protein